jgi:hypothetical protein
VSDLVFETKAYWLELSPDGLLARLSSPRGAPWASLRLLAALDTVQGPDETLAVEPPRVVAPASSRSSDARRGGSARSCG